MSTNKILIYPELSYLIVGICFSAHNELGPYAKEKYYANLIENKLKESQISFKRELIIGDTGNITDFIIEKKIILEVKAKRILTKDDYFQLQEIPSGHPIEVRFTSQPSKQVFETSKNCKN